MLAEQVFRDLDGYGRALDTLGQVHHAAGGPFLKAVASTSIYRSHPGFRDITWVGPTAARLASSTSMSPVVRFDASGEDRFLIISPVIEGGRIRGAVRAQIDTSTLLTQRLGYGAPRVSMLLRDDLTGSIAARWPGREAPGTSTTSATTIPGRALGRPWSLSVTELPTGDDGWKIGGSAVFLALVIPPLLIFLLVWALTRSRNRALRAVEAATTELRSRERELAHQATHDTLTGLPNRRLLSDHLELALARANRTDDVLALLFIDLDRFKEINDTHGHDIGDRVLKEVAQRMHDAVRPSDTVARLGGDEFVVLCDDVGSEAEAERVAGRISELLARPLLLPGGILTVTGSIGIAVRSPGDHVDAETMLQRADATMYEVKAAGRAGSRVAHASHSLSQNLMERREEHPHVERLRQDGARAKAS